MTDYHHMPSLYTILKPSWTDAETESQHRLTDSPNFGFRSWLNVDQLVPVAAASWWSSYPSINVDPLQICNIIIPDSGTVWRRSPSTCTGSFSSGLYCSCAHHTAAHLLHVWNWTSHCSPHLSLRAGQWCGPNVNTPSRFFFFLHKFIPYKLFFSDHHSDICKK